MSNRSETRHPDFAGLNLAVDPAGIHAIKAENVDLRKVGELSKRMGIRRVNQIRYHGAIVCIPDVQRICDYGRMLVLDYAGDIYSHDAPAAPPGADPFWNTGYPPIAHASASPMSGVVPLVVNFSSLGSFDPDGGPLTYLWAFGDGNFSTEPNPQHTYMAAGTPTATLTVTDVEGKTAVDSVGITVQARRLTSWGNRYSEDNGASWTAIDAVYRCTLSLGGDRIFAYRYGVGTTYLSTDGGKTFPAVGAITASTYLGRPVVCPNGRIIVPLCRSPIGPVSKVAYSDDGGATWNESHIRVVVAPEDAAPFAPQVVVMSDRLVAIVTTGQIGIGSQARWYQSLDWGVTWTYMRDATADEGDPTGTQTYRLRLFRVSGNSFILVNWNTVDGHHHVMLSTNKGASSVLVDTSAAAVINGPEFKARGSDVVGCYFEVPGVNTMRLKRSVNGGATWANLQDIAEAGPTLAWVGIASDATGWYVTTSNKVYFTTTLALPFAYTGTIPVTTLGWFSLAVED